MTDEKMKDFKVPALEKGIDILEALARSAEPRSLTSLCAELERSASELYRMIGYLEARGYIRRENPSGYYVLSLKLYELASLHPPVDRLIRASSGPMRELAMAVRESCHLSVLEDSSLIVLSQQESPEKIRFSVEVGARFDALATASGRLLLAHLPPAELEACLARHETFPSLPAEERQRVRARLRDIADSGYSHAEQETHLGTRDIAVYVGSSQTGVAAALAIPSLLTASKPAPDAGLLPALKSCARKIEWNLGMRNAAEHDA